MAETTDGRARYFVVLLMLLIVLSGCVRITEDKSENLQIEYEGELGHLTARSA